MIVADTNLIAYRLVEGEKTTEAVAVWDKDAEWFAPALWRHEFVSVLATHVRHGNLTEKESLSIFEHAVLLFRHREYQPSFSEALSLAIRREITPYDAQFVLCAYQLGTWLITSDRELLRKFPERAISPRNFLEMERGSVCESGTGYGIPKKRSLKKITEHQGRTHQSMMADRFSSLSPPSE